MYTLMGIAGGQRTVVALVPAGRLAPPSQAWQHRARRALAGEGVDLVKDAPSAAEVIERIVSEVASILTRGAALVR